MELKRPVIVEGPDGAGKTTLLEKLADDLDLPVYHTGGPNLSMDQLRNRLSDMRKRRRTHLFDRCPHVSDHIYAKAAGRVSPMDKEVIFDLLAWELSPVIIYCRLEATDHMLGLVSDKLKAHKSQEHLSMVRTRYLEIVNDYDELFREKTPGILVLRYDWQHDDYVALLEKIKCAASY